MLNIDFFVDKNKFDLMVTVFYRGEMKIKQNSAAIAILCTLFLLEKLQIIKSYNFYSIKNHFFQKDIPYLFILNMVL